MKDKQLKEKIKEFAEFRQKHNDGCAFYKLASYILKEDVNNWLRRNK